MYVLTRKRMREFILNYNPQWKQNTAKSEFEENKT